MKSKENLNKREFVNLMLHVSKGGLERVLKFLPKNKRPTVRKLAGEDWYNVLTFCRKDEARDMIPELKKIGCADIVEFPLSRFTP